MVLHVVSMNLSLSVIVLSKKQVLNFKGSHVNRIMNLLCFFYGIPIPSIEGNLFHNSTCQYC